MRRQTPSLLRGVLSLLLITFTAALSMGTFYGTAITPDRVTHTTETARPSTCRRECMEDSSCTGVSVTPLNPEMYVCNFTSEVVPGSGLLLNVTGAQTHYKKPCPSTFTVVPGVGCIMVSTDTRNYADATTACPPGSALFSPATDGIYWNLCDYLHKISTATNFWIGVSRNSTTMTWMWREGGTFPANVGEGLWGPIDPNENTHCARMAYAPTIYYFGHLADCACTNSYNYVCQVD